jgi:hypothetical protein
MPTAAALPKLADRLAQHAGAAARLMPESATLAMVALRVYADLLEQPSIEMLGQPYEVAVIDADDRKTEILALCRIVIVAKAAFTAAVEQRAGKRVKLTRGTQVHADRSAAVGPRGVIAPDFWIRAMTGSTFAAWLSAPALSGAPVRAAQAKYSLLAGQRS